MMCLRIFPRGRENRKIVALCPRNLCSVSAADPPVRIVGICERGNGLLMTRIFEAMHTN